MGDGNNGEGREGRIDLRRRTRDLALQIVRFYVSLPKTTEAQILGKQVLRSGTSIGAHFHEAHRAKSNADFVHKIEGALQEAEETLYWLDLLAGAGIVQIKNIAPIMQDIDRLIAIFVSIVRKVKSQPK